MRIDAVLLLRLRQGTLCTLACCSLLINLGQQPLDLRCQLVDLTGLGRLLAALAGNGDQLLLELAQLDILRSVGR